MNWINTNVVVTGGASFIGSRLTKALIALGARVKVVDDLSTGNLLSIQSLIEEKRLVFVRTDLRDPEGARDAVRNAEVVFHLAATHGGRGYITSHQAACTTNFVLDGTVIRAARDANVRQFVFASSACVYPTGLQASLDNGTLLREDMVGPPYDADNTYGWAKLMAEVTLRACYAEEGFASAICRYFTVYGPGGGESHAVHAMIARAYGRQDPFEIWGDGQQVRNWTYVDDIVRGTILCAEKITNAEAVNLGTRQRIRVIEAASLICSRFNFAPRWEFLPHMPVGPVNRAADNSKAKDLLDWTPQVTFEDGIDRTVEWYRHVREVP